MSIETMKLALEALTTLDSGSSYKTHTAATALYRAIEQADAQEPVGFVHPEDLQSVTLGHNSYAAIYVETEGHTGGIPLYTTPPQHEWVGLTEDEKAEIRGSVKYSQFMSALEYGILVQDATEAKLKTKNAYGWQSVSNATEYLDDLRGGTDLCGND